jgi:hypothetical protein
MCNCIRPCALAVLFAAALFRLPQLGADDCDEPDHCNREKARIEQEFARKVERYNQLLKEGRFDESIAVGKEARVLQPENPVAEIMVLKGMLSKQDVINRLSIRFKATLTADVQVDPDGSRADKPLRITDAAIDRLLCGEEGGAGNGRRLLNAALERRIEAIDANCRLSGAQRRKLQLAGRGDIKRFLDRVDAVRPTSPRTDDDLEDLTLCGMAWSWDDEARVPARRFGLFEQGSLFSKMVKTLLTESQAAAFEAARSNSP